MNCHYCNDICHLTIWSRNQSEPLSTDNDPPSNYRYQCKTCMVDYCFINNFQGNRMTRIIFDAITLNDKLYRILLDLETNKTWLGMNVDIGGLNFYKTVYEIKQLLPLQPNNIVDKIKTILVFQ